MFRRPFRRPVRIYVESRVILGRVQTAAALVRAALRRCFPIQHPTLFPGPGSSFGHLSIVKVAPIGFIGMGRCLRFRSWSEMRSGSGSTTRNWNEAMLDRFEGAACVFRGRKSGFPAPRPLLQRESGTPRRATPSRESSSSYQRNPAND